MVFSCTATPEPSNVPPRVLIEAVESDPDLSIQTVAFFRDGAPLRFEPAVTGDSAVAYDYDAPFDVALTYRADGTELGSPLDWTEDWASLADWSGSGWAVGSGVASSTSPGAILYRDTTSGTVLSLVVTLPSNLTLQLTDASDNVVVSVLVSPDGTVTLTGSTASKVTGSGTFTLSLSSDAASIAGTGWDTSVAYSGDPTRVRLVAPPVASFVSKFGESGTADGQFIAPYDVAIDSTGRIWVADVYRVQVLDSTGAFLFKIGGTAAGTADGEFTAARGIAIDGSGRAWVTDSSLNRVQVFDSTGAFLFKFGTFGTGNGQLKAPIGIAIDSGGNAQVVEQDNNRVQKFNSAGTYVSKFGGPGATDGLFSVPQYVAINAAGDIIVADLGNDRIQRFNSAGVFQAKFGSAGTGDGQFGGPRGVVVDSSGNIWVSDSSANHTIQKFNSAGVFQGRFGSDGTGDGLFESPAGMVFDSAGDLLIADAVNDRIQRFTTDPGSVDDLILRIALDEPVDVTATDTATLSPTGATAGAWLTNAATPDLAILAEAEPASSDDEFFIVTTTRESGQLAANTVALPIEGSPDVLTVVLGPRFKETWTLDIACTTQAAYQTLTALMANSSVISLRFPATPRWVGLDGGFYAVGDMSAERRGHPQLGPIIVASLPLLPARAPKFKPLWQWSWNTLVQTGMSWDDVAANFDSWNDVLVGPN